MLEKIESPKDLKNLTTKEKKELSEEIRKYILEIVSKNGGHLASNLGIVELTIAIHSVYNVPEDKIIWDVGHQSYVHKIITGRKDELKTLRTLNGIAGFPKTNESETDCFNTGHSSTSISAALGMARARDIQGKDNSVIAVIGDGALTGGMALEALNDAGYSKSNITVILNDNEMSISPNTGGLNKFLGKLRTKKLYKRTNKIVKAKIEKIPLMGKPTVKIIQHIKRAIKQLVINRMYFEDIGYTYLGPVDGHNIEELESILTISKQVQGPVLIHVLTQKGKGYKIAEEKPEKFHATGSFNIETGESTKPKKIDYSKVFGEKLIELAEKNEKIVAITAAMKDGTGLTKFQDKFKNRFFDVGIAEQHAITMAAGMAKGGLIPVVPIYSSFYQRSYDQVIHDVAMQNLHVVMCVDRAGIVGADGETHQGLFDMAFFKIIPNLTILAPKDFKEFEDMLEFSINAEGPIVIRYPRGEEDQEIKFEKHEKIEKGKAEILQEGKDISIISIGKMVSKAKKIANILKEENIESEVINVRFLKPLDNETIINSINKTKKVITIEDGTIIGGLATSIKELIIENNLKDIEIKTFGYPDEFIEHGSVNELEELYGITEKEISKEIQDLKNKNRRIYMSIYDLNVMNGKGEEVSLSEFKGKVLLIVNTATGCGFTPQYEGLEKMYQKYHEKGLEILDFPCNQFGNQAPGTDEEIHEFCTLKYHTSFDQFKKVDVNGENESPLFTFLKSQKGFDGFDGLKGKILIPVVKSMDPDYKNNSNIKWNFTKFLVDRDGNVIERFESTVTPEKIEQKVEELL